MIYFSWSLDISKVLVLPHIVLKSFVFFFGSFKKREILLYIERHIRSSYSLNLNSISFFLPLCSLASCGWREVAQWWKGSSNGIVVEEFKEQLIKYRNYLIYTSSLFARFIFNGRFWSL